MAPCTEIIVVGLILAVTFHSVANAELGSDIRINVVESLAEFLNANPGVKLQPLMKEEKTDGPSPYIQLIHRAGGRISGDRFLAADQGSQSWSSPQDVQLNLNYPKSGIGAIVTFIEIIVDQVTILIFRNLW